MTTLSVIQSKEELNEHMNEFTNVLSQAFWNDPYYTYIMPNNEKRISQMKWWMKILLKYTQKYGTIYFTSDYKGVAMWVGPDKPNLDNIQLAILGLIAYPFKVGINNFLRMLDVSTQWEQEHKKQNKRHYYLLAIGVEPSLQRTGMGSKLMQDILQKADNEKLDCFLETVTEENVMFYQKHKFEVVYEKDFGNNSHYWLMKRTPN